MPAGHKKHRPEKMNSKSAHQTSGAPVKVNNHHTTIVKTATKIESSTFSPSPSAVIPSASVLQSVVPTPSTPGIPPLEQSPTPSPVSPPSSSNGSIIGGVLGAIILCLIIVIYALYRRIKKKKEYKRHKGILTNCTEGGWNVTRSWSTLDTNNNSKCVNNTSTDMNSPPPAYYCSSRANKKRWTQDSVISKQSSFVKQYSPQLAYSPSQSTILQVDHEGVSPSHTLVDTSGSLWLHQKDNLNLPEYEDDQQQRRSIQPYQAQLDISSSFSDALDPPGSYHSGMLLQTHTSHTS